MKKIVILKLDMPLTLVRTAMHVPAAEPVNFAYALADVEDVAYDIVLFGLSSQMEERNESTIRVVPYFGDFKTVKSIFDDNTTVIIWQGRHAIQIPSPNKPQDLENTLEITEPWHCDYYEKLSLLKSWQIMLYNLIPQIPDECKKFFLLTDVRLPLMELNKIDSALVPKPLPKDITLITQCNYHEHYRKWANHWGNGQWYPETDIQDYTYQFKNSLYAPLHCLPLISHSKFHKELDRKTEFCTFQMQSLKFMDDYRKQKLGKAIDYFKGDVILNGQFGHKEHALLRYNYPKYAEKLIEHTVGTNDSYEAFDDAAKSLSNFIVSIIVSDGRYVRFGLCPNRFVEALAVGSMPYMTANVMDNVDDTLKEIVNKYIPQNEDFDAFLNHVQEFKETGTRLAIETYIQNLENAKAVLEQQLKQGMLMLSYKL